MKLRIVSALLLSVFISNSLVAKNVIVIGAGMAGLTAAITAIDNGCNVTLLESQNYAGGKIYSEELGGIQANLGAQYIVSGVHPIIDYYIDTIRTKKLRDLKTGYVQNSLYSDLGITNYLKLVGAIMAISEDRAASVGAKEYYFDKYPANTLWNQFENMAADYYLETYKTLDAFAVEYIESNLKSEAGGNLSNLAGLLPVDWYGKLDSERFLLRDGNECLATAMKDDLVAKGGTVHFGKVVTNVAVNGSVVDVTCLDNSTYSADYVVVATPSYVAKNIVSGLSTAKSDALDAVEYSANTIVSLYLKNFPDGTDLHGVLYMDEDIDGFLNQTGSVLTIGKSDRYWLQNTTVISVIVTNPTLLAMTDANLVAAVGSQLQLTEPNFDPSCDIIDYKINRFDNGIVKFPLEFITNYQDTLRASVSDKIFFAGDYIYAPDLSGAARAGEVAAEEILAL